MMIKFKRPAYNEFYMFTSLLDSDTLVLTDKDGNDIELDSTDLFNAFRVLSSTEFSDFIGSLEKYANACEDSLNAYKNLDSDKENYYAQTKYIEGFAKGVANNQLTTLAKRVSIYDVQNAIRMYESLYDVYVMGYVSEVK